VSKLSRELEKIFGDVYSFVLVKKENGEDFITDTLYKRDDDSLWLLRKRQVKTCELYKDKPNDPNIVVISLKSIKNIKNVDNHKYIITYRNGKTCEFIKNIKCFGGVVTYAESEMFK